MKNTCIICGSEFESSRKARFCPDKPGCRQAYNRKERHIKDLASQIAAARDELIGIAGGDVNLGMLASEEIKKAEKELITRLDQVFPGRHPIKKEVTAYPVFADPQPGDKLFAFDPRYQMGDMIKITVSKVKDGWVEGSLDGKRWETVKLSLGCVYLKVVEPETDRAGREVIDKYNPGWGAVVNPDRQIEIAAIDTPTWDEDYSEDDEDE